MTINESGNLRRTVHVELVLLVLRSRHPEPVYGMELVNTSGLYAGTVYPILRRLRHYGWLESRWEQMDPSVQGRPRRRYYTLTSAGLLGTASLDGSPLLKALATEQAGTAVVHDAHG